MAKKKRTTPNNNEQGHFKIRHINPITTSQESAFSAYDNGYNLVLHGYAGTGKSFISLYLALNEILSDETSPYEQIIIIRSVVPSRDMGFLPGTIREKIAVYEDPYKEICDDLFDRGDGYNILKMKELVKFTTTSFLRGTTFKNAIVIIDEAQNLQYHELYTTITRLGDTSRLILIGDFRQTDLKKHEDKSLGKIINILKRLPSVAFVEFDKSEIVRGQFVKDFIIASTEYGD